MPKNINSLVYFDVETGGLDCKKCAVTEVAMVAIKGDTLEKIDLVSTFIKPYGDYIYEPEALKYSGISTEDIESGGDVKEVVNEIISLFEKCNLYPRNKGSKPVLIAHNSAFDKGFLCQIFNYAGKMKELERLTYGNVDFWGNYQPEMMDSVLLSKMMWGNDEDMVNFKLGTCIAKAGLELNDAHKAINDTIAMKDMVVGFINKMRSKGDTIGEVIEKESFRKHFQM